MAAKIAFDRGTCEERAVEQIDGARRRWPVELRTILPTSNDCESPKDRTERRGAAEAMDGRSSVHVMEDMVAF